MNWLKFNKEKLVAWAMALGPIVFCGLLFALAVPKFFLFLIFVLVVFGIIGALTWCVVEGMDRLSNMDY